MNDIEIVLMDNEKPNFKTYSEWSHWFYNQNPELFDRWYPELCERNYDLTKSEQE